MKSFIIYFRQRPSRTTNQSPSPRIKQQGSIQTHSILTPTHPQPITPHALQIRRAPANQAIALQTLIIAAQLRELRERIAGCAALGAA
jgi:hypothetical protein